jgi:hypothetical protein
VRIAFSPSFSSHEISREGGDEVTDEYNRGYENGFAAGRVTLAQDMTTLQQQLAAVIKWAEELKAKLLSIGNDNRAIQELTANAIKERDALRSDLSAVTAERDVLRELMIEAITKVPQMCVFLGWGSQDPEEAAQGVDSIMMYAVGRKAARR